MTDKQIIIDGVDVSGCPYYIDSDGSCSSHDCECIKCIDNVCFYKDYKAKEQECEELRERINCRCFDPKSNNNRCISYNRITEDYERDLKQLDQLKAENDGLKIMLKDLSYENQKFCYQIEEQTKQLEPFKDEYFKGLDNVAIAKLAKKSIRITAENSKLEQTLTEIKEICNSVENIENINSLYDAKLSGMYLQANKILQKISECEANQ